jgi:hypothetical protein
MSSMALNSNGCSYQPKAVIDNSNVEKIPISISFGEENCTECLGAMIGTQVGEITNGLAWFVK